MNDISIRFGDRRCDANRVVQEGKVRKWESFAEYAMSKLQGVVLVKLANKAEVKNWPSGTWLYSGC